MKGLYKYVLLALSGAVVLGCNGRDRFDDCYFNGEPVPEFEITAYNAVTGERVCWTEYTPPVVVGQKGWEYQGPCEYTFDDAGNPASSTITVTVAGFESNTLVDVQKPTGDLCILEGEQEIVDFYLTPSAL